MKKVSFLVVGGILLAMSIAFMVSCSSGGTTKVGLDTVTLAYTNDNIVKAFAGTANITGIEPTWELESLVGITYTIAAATTEGPTADGAGTKVKINTSGIITIDSTAVADNSGKYVVTAKASADSLYYTADSTATATVQVTVYAADTNLNVEKLSYEAITATTGTANTTGVLPKWEGGLADTTGITYTIAAIVGAITGQTVPAVDGAGGTVAIDSTTGKVTIQAAAVVGNTGTYKITATAGPTSPYQDASTETATITVTVNASTATN